MAKYVTAVSLKDDGRKGPNILLTEAEAKRARARYEREWKAAVARRNKYLKKGK